MNIDIVDICTKMWQIIAQSPMSVAGFEPSQNILTLVNS